MAHGLGKDGWPSDFTVIQSLNARVAELEAHNETRNIELLASVQQCAQLKAQLIAEQVRADANEAIVEHQNKLILMAKEALAFAKVWMPGAEPVKHTLAAINDSKLVEGLVLCGAEPRSYIYKHRSAYTGEFVWSNKQTYNGTLALESLALYAIKST